MFRRLVQQVGVIRPCGKRWLSSSPRELAEKESQVLKALRGVRLGESDRDIVSAGLVKNLQVKDGTVHFRLGEGDIRTIKACERAITQAGIEWLTSKPMIELGAGPPIGRVQQQKTSRVASQEGLEGVKYIVAVSSCKGGVGKSTVAVNLACALAEKGKVGILDADVYGPSLPTMMVPQGAEWAVVRSKDQKMIEPVFLHGIKCMSYGFVAPGTGGRGVGDGGSTPGMVKANSGQAAVLRGPMVSSIVTQLACQTDWGELDYLVLDMPPGTGDISISLAQQLRISGSVIVTTPQRLAFVDVVKGLEMFDKLKVPTISVVENMAWFDGDDGKRYYPFGPGHRGHLVEGFGIKHSYTLPILQDTSSCGDGGTPFFIQHSQSEVANVYRRIAKGVQDELENASDKITGATTSVTLDEASNRLLVRFITPSMAKEYRIKPIELRKRLRKVDEMLGMKVEDLSEDIRPVTVQPMGNYAVSITWSDGHDASIYPYTDVVEACEEIAG